MTPRAAVCFLLFAIGFLWDRPARADSVTLTQTLSARLLPAAKLAVPATVQLLASGAAFQPFSGTLTVSYRVRTSRAGTGAITLQVTSDFSPAGGPSAAAGSLTYACDPATLGTSCQDGQTAATALQSPVLSLPPAACTGGGGPCSTADPGSIRLNFKLDNTSAAATGTYAAQITFLISAI